MRWQIVATIGIGRNREDGDRRINEARTIRYSGIVARFGQLAAQRHKISSIGDQFRNLQTTARPKDPGWKLTTQPKGGQGSLQAWFIWD